MDVKEIPLRVFEEMSEKFGEGNESVVRHSSMEYRVRELKDGGYIVYVEDLDFPNNQFDSKMTIFAVWHRLPAEDNFFPSIFEIRAGPFSDGSWVYGSGRRMIEDATARFTPKYIRLDNPLVTVISEALLSAQIMALAPDCQRDQYWESERCPEGAYEHPP